MIIDSSAVIAILNTESDAADLSDVIRQSTSNVMGAPTLLESSIVATADGRDSLDRLLTSVGVLVVPFDEDMARVAREAYARYGRNSGSKARLNFGDCMSYAVAKVRNEPLLFKGDDFTYTDITPALG